MQYVYMILRLMFGENAQICGCYEMVMQKIVFFEAKMISFRFFQKNNILKLIAYLKLNTSDPHPFI